MNNPKSTLAQQIAQAAIAFEQRRTGNHVPKSVTVVLSEGTLVITLHEALSPAERQLAKSAAGAAQMQEFHRQLFASSSEALRQEINRITGMQVREAAAEVVDQLYHLVECEGIEGSRLCGGILAWQVQLRHLSAPIVGGGGGISAATSESSSQ